MNNSHGQCKFTITLLQTKMVNIKQYHILQVHYARQYQVSFARCYPVTLLFWFVMCIFIPLALWIFKGTIYFL